MAAEVGGLLINLGLDVAQIKQDVGKAQREMSGFRRKVDQQMGRMQRSFRRATSGLQGLVAVAGIGALTRKIGGLVQQTAKLDESADAAGITAERYQELTKAFSDMGGVAESVTAGALRRFNRRLGLARQGTGAAVDTLERLNISLEQDTTSAVDAAIQKLVQMDDQADRAAAASQLFGEDAGPKLAAALNEGGEALDATIRKLHEQGRIMEEETAESARKLNDRYNELADTLNTKLKSAIVGAVEGWRDLLGMTEGAQFASLQAELDSLANRRDRILENIDDSPWPDQLRDELQKVNQEMIDIQKRMQKMRQDAASERNRQDSPDPVAEPDTGSNGRRQTFAGLGRGTRKSMGYLEAVREIDAETRRLRESTRETGREINTVQTRMRDQQQEVNRTFERTGQVVASSLARAADEGRGLRGVIQGLAEDLVRLQVREASSEIGNALTGALSASFGGGASSTGGALASVGGVGGATPRAEGGPVRRGERYLVGEKGPELFTPGRSGGITPNDKIGGGDTIYQIDARGADAAAVARLERTIKAVNGSIERRAVNAVGSQRQRSFRG